MALGARRLHVLPTPISSFLACAPTEAEAAELAREPLLESLSTRMKTRVGLRAIDGLSGTPAPFAGVAAIAGGDKAAATVEWLLQHGAAEVLVLPRNAPSPTRVYIHWTDEAVRRATLAVSASLLRHVSAEAVYLGIVPEGRAGARAAPRRCASCSTRAPKRSSATASRCAPSSPSARRSPSSRATCRPGTAQMLVLGITDITQAGTRVSQPAGRAAGLAGAHRLSAAGGRRCAPRPRSAA